MKKILLIISVALMIVNISSCGVKGSLTLEKQNDKVNEEKLKE